MPEKPGIILYFDILPCLEELNDTQVGRLLRATLYYSQSGVLPDFSDDRMLTIAWPFLQSQADADEKRYRRRVQQQRKAATCQQEREVL